MERERARKRKYSLKVKNIMSDLETTLVSLDGLKPNTNRRVLQHALLTTQHLEEDMSQVLANIRTDDESAVKNASRFTLTSVKAAFSRHLREAEQKTQSFGLVDEEAQNILENYMEKAANTYFTSMAREARAEGVATYIADKGISSQNSLLASPSPSTSSATNGVDSLATPGGSHQQENGHFTPNQNEIELTPSFANPKKQRGLATPVNTPAAANITPAELRKKRPSFCKKILTFPDEILPISKKKTELKTPMPTLAGPGSTKRSQENSDVKPEASGSGLPPFKRTRFFPDIDVDIGQDLLPVPIHFKAQRSTTALSDLKCTPSSSAHSRSPTKASIVKKINSVQLASGQTVSSSERSHLDSLTSKFVQQIALAAVADSKNGKTQDHCAASCSSNGTLAVDEKCETSLAVERGNSFTAESGVLVDKKEYFVIGQCGPFGCIKKKDDVEEQKTRASTGLKLRYVECDPCTSSGTEDLNSDSMHCASQCTTAVSISPNHEKNISCVSSSSSDNSPHGFRQQGSSPLSPCSPWFFSSPRCGKYIESTFSLRTHLKSQFVTPEKILTAAAAASPSPSGYQFATPKAKGTPPGVCPYFTPRRRCIEGASPSPSHSGFRTSTPRGNFMPRFSPMWGSFRCEESTPETNYVVLNVQAPRKKTPHVPARRTPSCKRSLARQFAEMSQTSGTFITPPRSPEGINFCLPGLDSDSDE